MFSAFKVGVGALCFYFAVLQPLRASLLAVFAIQSGLDQQTQAVLLERASLLDPCNTSILDAAGTAWVKTKNYTMAAIAFGKIMQCSPGHALARFKYGACLITMGFKEGLSPMRDALTLEPNNPYFKAEVQRLTALQ